MTLSTLGQQALKARPMSIGRCAGWLTPGGPHAVLMCGAHGFEALSSRLAWHVLADFLAQRGLTVLRFDYPGDGDSLDLAPGEALVPALGASITAAADWLRQHCAVQRLSCVSLRLGALLAGEALKDLPGGIDSHAVLAPPASGRAYLRELKITAKLFADTRGYPPPEDGHIDLCGYELAPAAIADLGALKRQGEPPARRRLIVDTNGPDAAEAGPDAARHLRFDGYAAFMQDPSHAIIPFGTFERVADWLAAAEPAVSPLPACPAIVPANRLAGPDFVENRIVFGAEGQLTGVLCRPRKPASATPSVLIINAGANSHEGWARGAVEQARLLAGDGVASLRFDLSGIGDSIWFREGPRPHLYSQQHILDTIAAVDAMEREGLHHPVLTGLCAGGFVAFQAGVRDRRIGQVVAANVLRLIWTAEDNIDDYERNTIQTMAAYRQQFRSGRAVRRILSGEVSARRLWQIACSTVCAGVMRLAARLGISLPPEPASRQVRSQLLTLARRGAGVTFVHSALDQSIAEAERHFGSGFHFARKQPGIVFETIPGADHELTPRSARLRYLEIIRQRVKGA